ncbi:MAG: cytosolic protein [Prevotellaceae bacterium]|jgi:hypothetical protein|nr:cytosolic protein [Prevotellaceae bacterium]
MNILNIKDITQYVNDNIAIFHEKRLKSLDTLKLEKVLNRKNPYLFKAKFAETSEQIVRGIVDAHISSNEETIFGDWLEELAVFVNQKVYGGWKSSAKSIDLEFDKDSIRYIVNIKSGNNWGNSSQISKMKADFSTAKKTLRTGGSGINIIAVNGCCYGKDNNPDKGDYFKYCGQEFWTFISGNENLYLDIIEPLGTKAKERNEEFQNFYNKMINRFTKEFSNSFCNNDGDIDWQKLVEFNSGKKKKK